MAQEVTTLPDMTLAPVAPITTPIVPAATAVVAAATAATGLVSVPALIESTPNVVTVPQESLGYFAKAHNYIQSMSTRNFYIFIIVLIVLLVASFYYIWNKFFSKKPETKEVVKRGPNNSRAGPENSKRPEKDSRDFRDSRELQDYDPRYGYLCGAPGSAAQDPRNMDPRFYQDPKHVYPSRNRKDDDKTHESSERAKKNENIHKTPIFSNSNQYGEVYGSESVDALNHVQPHAVGGVAVATTAAASTSQQIANQHDVSNNVVAGAIPDDIANYEPDGITGN